VASQPVNWQMIDMSMLLFPAGFLINYVRIYWRKDQFNTGCNPKDFPTVDYNASHIDAYEGELLFFGCLVVAYCGGAYVTLVLP
jgi:hypothetical protein